MPLLRLTQTEGREKLYRVELALERAGIARQVATTEFDFTLSPQDREDLRWYLEEFLQYPAPPAPSVAERVEGRLADVGTELFRAIFQATDDARDLWATLRSTLNETRVEVAAAVQATSELPWELLRDPKTNTALALRAQAFVRTQPEAPQPLQLPSGADGLVRILLVICRPGGRDDVPFRSVASHLVKGLHGSARERVIVDVLRPPTFERLGRVLRQAKDNNIPYHVVHFDGHGTYLDANDADEMAALQSRLNSVTLGTPRLGKHGYLLFEQPIFTSNIQLVDGSELGDVLVETGVPVLVLNACRSAHAEAPTEPKSATGSADVHSQVRALGSLAQEVMDAGVPGVVAMRYNVYVVTAAQFVGDLYEALSQGRALGEAVSFGRKQLHSNPLREIGFRPLPLQDWPVPVVYEAAPIRLFAERGDAPSRRIALDEEQGLAVEMVARDLPPRPDAGFFGRDETLLALDRAFDHASILLLHAYAGSGKTATAAEFARWYAKTGGIEGRVLFTSFERYKPLSRVLDVFPEVFGDLLAQAGVQWFALEDERRRTLALDVMRQIPVLWIWDNVEPVNGFPTGTPSDWSDAEQAELVDFLRAAQELGAKFLLTSRRPEDGWLGGLPTRIRIPRMPMQERVQLARALAEKQQRQLADVDDWRPLLRFTDGNPLTVTVLVGQVLRERLATREQVEAFVRRLRAGEGDFVDEEAEGRAKSLGASLSYGFEHAFDEAERHQLALLHLFQGFIDVDVLRTMGAPKAKWCLPVVHGISRDQGIALLNRAAEVGLLTALGGGCYGIHPAVPWYFAHLFKTAYDEDSEAPRRAFVEAMGDVAAFYSVGHASGHGEAIGGLNAEEANLLHAYRIASVLGCWDAVGRIFRGLGELYEHTGQRAALTHLLEAVVPDLVDPATDGPLPGRENAWSQVNLYRARAAGRLLDFAEAERLFRIDVDRRRQLDGQLLDHPPEEPDDHQRRKLINFAVVLEQLAHIQRERGEGNCVEGYEEALEIFERVGELSKAEVIVFNLGVVYGGAVPVLRDLDRATYWYHRSLEMMSESDVLGRARTTGQLGDVAISRFRDCREAGGAEEEMLRHLNNAANRFHQVLELIPETAVEDLAVTHAMLGFVYGEAGLIEKARDHYQQSIRHRQDIGDVLGAGKVRLNFAIDLASVGRLGDALAFARAALHDFQSFGERAADSLRGAQSLITEIEIRMKR